jgi:hypothetical protein
VEALFRVAQPRLAVVHRFRYEAQRPDGAGSTWRQKHGDRIAGGRQSACGFSVAWHAAVSGGGGGGGECLFEVTVGASGLRQGSGASTGSAHKRGERRPAAVLPVGAQSSLCRRGFLRDFVAALQAIQQSAAAGPMVAQATRVLSAGMSKQGEKGKEAAAQRLQSCRTEVEEGTVDYGRLKNANEDYRQAKCIFLQVPLFVGWVRAPAAAVTDVSVEV